MLHPRVDVPYAIAFRTVWLLRNLGLGGELFLRISLPSLAVAGEPGKRHARRANKLQVDSDCLNANSLGIMSAFSHIENLANNSTCLIDYQEITRSIKLFLV